MRKWIPLLLPCLALALGSLPAHGWQKSLTPAKQGPHPRLQPIELDYSLTWKGMVNAGEITLTFGPRNVKKPGMFVITTQARSKGLAATMFPYSHHFWSELHQATLRPRLFVADESGRKERTKTTNLYTAAKVDSTENELDKKGAVTAVGRTSFAFRDVNDLFSAMLLVRSQPLKNGEKTSLVVMPFKPPYLLQVEVIGREQHHGRPAIKLSVSMRKIDRKTSQLRPYKKLNRSATMWLSDDASRIPLELRADVFIGDVRAVLTKSRQL